MDLTFEADPRVFNRVGLEPQLSDKVQTTHVPPLSGDHAEGVRIKILSAIHEIGMVQNVNGRELDLELNCFGDRDPLGQTQIEIKVLRTAEAVDREIAECTRRRSRHQAGFKSRGGDSALRIQSDVQQIGIDEEYSSWRPEQPDVPAELLKAYADELRPIISRGTVESRSARGDVEGNPRRPHGNSSDGVASDEPVHHTAGTGQKALTPSERKFVNAVCYEPLCLIIARPAIIKAPIAKREEADQITLVVSLGIHRVTHCFAPGVVHLELQSVREAAPQLDL